MDLKFPKFRLIIALPINLVMVLMVYGVGWTRADKALTQAALINLVAPWVRGSFYRDALVELQSGVKSKDQGALKS